MSLQILNHFNRAISHNVAFMKIAFTRILLSWRSKYFLTVQVCFIFYFFIFILFFKILLQKKKLFPEPGKAKINSLIFQSLYATYSLIKFNPFKNEPSECNVFIKDTLLIDKIPV